MDRSARLWNIESGATLHYPLHSPSLSIPHPFHPPSQISFFRLLALARRAEEYEMSYEIGPGTVCRGIVKRFGKKIPVTSVQA